MSEAYRRLLRREGRLQEAPSRRPVSELELQARFYRGEYGTEWTGTDGEPIRLIHPGEWNREPGPDFRNARLLIADREERGDIEIDGRDKDWESHGHAENEAFRDVLLHGFFQAGSRRFYTRTCDHKNIPQVLLPESPAPSAAPKPSVQADPLEKPEAIELVEAAARYRLSVKRKGFATAAHLCGRDEALFQALAGCLGYKNNKLPFLLVAQRLGLDRAFAGNGEALLFGLAGFLQADDFDAGDEEDKEYLGPLWQEWWKVRDLHARLVLPEGSWNFAALRPQNHPHRRLGALAVILSHFTALRRLLAQGDIAASMQLLQGLEHRYWSRHWNLDSAFLVKPMRLLGLDRVRDIAINALIPSLEDEAAALRELRTLDGPSPAGKITRAVTWLTGSDRMTGFTSAFHQQGLVQVYDDFFPGSPRVVLEGYRSTSTKADSSAIVEG